MFQLLSTFVRILCVCQEVEYPFPPTPLLFIYYFISIYLSIYPYHQSLHHNTFFSVCYFLNFILLSLYASSCSTSFRISMPTHPSLSLLENFSRFYFFIRVSVVISVSVSIYLSIYFFSSIEDAERFHKHLDYRVYE